MTVQSFGWKTVIHHPVEDEKNKYGQKYPLKGPFHQLDM